VLVESGFGGALIQRREVIDSDYSSVMLISLAFACVLYAVLFVASPFIASFYDMPLLKPVMRAMSLILFFNAVNSVQNARLIWDFRYKVILFANMAGIVISGGVGIVMAYLGFGVWALAAQQIINRLCVCVAMAFVSGLKLKYKLNAGRVRVLFSFGSKLLAVSVIGKIYENLRSMIIAKKYSSETLAFYDKGIQYPGFLMSGINNAVESVMLPAFSREQDDDGRLRTMLLRSVSVCSYIITPMMIGFALVARPLITILLTEKWLGCVPYLRLYCVFYIIYPVSVASVQVMLSKGRSGLSLAVNAVNYLFGICAVLAAVFIFNKPEAVAWSAVASELFSFFINSRCVGRLIGLKYGAQLKAVVPSLLLSASMGAVIWLAGLALPGDLLKLSVQIITGIIWYAAFSHIFKVKEYLYIREILKNLLKKPAGQK
jgi:O-antigen/teichoic acid export membrane protein